MIEYLRKDFKLTQTLTRVAFVVCYVLANFMRCMGATVIVLGGENIAMALFVALIIGTLLAFVLPFVVNLLLNFANIYSVPREEYKVLFLITASAYYLLNALFGIVNFFTPLLLAWGTQLFSVLASAVCAFAFYVVTSKLYFNNSTVVHYFKCVAICYIVGIVVFGVIL